jgi:hypothetical protein
VIQVQRLRRILGQVEDIVEPVDETVDRRPREWRKERAAQQRQRLVHHAVRPLLDRLDLAHATAGIADIGQQLRQRFDAFDAQSRLRAEQRNEAAVARDQAAQHAAHRPAALAALDELGRHG